MVAGGLAAAGGGSCAKLLPADARRVTNTMPNGFISSLVISKSRLTFASRLPVAADRPPAMPPIVAPRRAARAAGRGHTSARLLRCAAPTARGGPADCAGAAAGRGAPCRRGWPPANWGRGRIILPSHAARYCPPRRSPAARTRASVDRAAPALHLAGGAL